MYNISCKVDRKSDLVILPWGISHSVVVKWPSRPNDKVCSDQKHHGMTTADKTCHVFLPLPFCSEEHLSTFHSNEKSLEQLGKLRIVLEGLIIYHRGIPMLLRIVHDLHSMNLETITFQEIPFEIL